VYNIQNKRISVSEVQTTKAGATGTATSKE
jgi:hypothetical protein